MFVQVGPEMALPFVVSILHMAAIHLYQSIFQKVTIANEHILPTKTTLPTNHPTHLDQVAVRPSSILSVSNPSPFQWPRRLHQLPPARSPEKDGHTAVSSSADCAPVPWQPHI